MAKKEKQTEVLLKLKDKQKLITFLTNFKSVDTNIMLEFEDEEIYAKTFTGNDAIAKMTSYDINELFEVVSSIPDNFKIGIFNVDKFIKVLGVLNEDAELTIPYTIEKDGVAFSLTINIKTPSLKKTVISAARKLFKSLTLDQAKLAFSEEDSYFKMFLDKRTMKYILDLASLESNKMITVKYTDGNIVFEGKEYSYNYQGQVEKLIEEDFTFILEKDSFKYTDKEDYDVYGKENSFLFVGKETGTKIALALVEDEPIDEDLDEL